MTTTCPDPKITPIDILSTRYHVAVNRADHDTAQVCGEEIVYRLQLAEIRAYWAPSGLVIGHDPDPTGWPTCTHRPCTDRDRRELPPACQVDYDLARHHPLSRLDLTLAIYREYAWPVVA